MGSTKQIFMCMRTNFIKWRKSPVIYTILSIYIAFAVWNLTWVVQFCYATDSQISPWVFPFTFLYPAMVTFYCATVMMLFANAPFDDGHTPFLMIRTGKCAWILGQLFYVLLASLILPLLCYASMLLILLPRLGFSMNWGGVLKTIASDRGILEEYGIQASGIFFDSMIMNNMSALEATLEAFMLVWAGSAFLGIVIFFFNIVCKPGSGVIAAGILVFISALAPTVGQLLFGRFINYIAIPNWISYAYLQPYAYDAPNVFQAMMVLLLSILILSAISVLVFCQKDYNIQKTAR